MSQVETAMALLLQTFDKYAGTEGKKDTLTKAELKSLMAKEMPAMMKVAKDPDAVDKLMNVLDHDKDAEVDFQEFMVMIAALTCACHARCPSKERVLFHGARHVSTVAKNGQMALERTLIIWRADIQEEEEEEAVTLVKCDIDLDRGQRKNKTPLKAGRQRFALLPGYGQGGRRPKDNTPPSPRPAPFGGASETAIQPDAMLAPPAAAAATASHGTTLPAGAGMAVGFLDAVE
ncbi:Protein S100-P [Merluccius polli]|uniref:Protein S100-P n=1 Tax=Merluccius polli TaxID=89951 RepID=A0AA47M7P0_MERPO|nr:Protein S100-P [Merluccius polli]